MSPGRWSALPHLSGHAAIASGSRCYLPISSASCDLADLDCGARAAHKMNSHSGLLRRTFAGLPSSLLDRRRQQSCTRRDQCRTSAPPLIKMPPASSASPLHKGRSEEPTTNIADFCNKICQQGTWLWSRRILVYPPALHDNLKVLGGVGDQFDILQRVALDQQQIGKRALFHDAELPCIRTTLAGQRE